MSQIEHITDAVSDGKKLLAILLDPDKFPYLTKGTAVTIDSVFAKAYLAKIPSETTHLFVGGSTDAYGKTEEVVQTLKQLTDLPILLFPGDYTQVTPKAHGILFLSLLSGRNPEYLIEQQVKAALPLHESKLEIIPTGYILIDGGTETAVQRVSETNPMPQTNIPAIVSTALAGEYLGKKIIYLEAGSGAKKVVHPDIIKAVKKLLSIPLIVGGGIKSAEQMQAAYEAGADLVVIGTAFEEDSWKS